MGSVGHVERCYFRH